MQPAVQRLLLPFGHDLVPARWIFVVGCYNSGTTLLASILRRHPDMAGLPNEGGFLTDALPYPEQFGWPRMWCRCLDKVRLEPHMEGAARASRIKRHWSLWYPHGAQNLIEKSIANAARMPFLEAHFQPAHFIYIVRNGYAVAGGIRDKANLKRWRSPYAGSGYPIELCAEQWRVTDDVVQQDRQRVGRFLQVYYEDLTERPADVLRTITDFLQLPPVPDQVVRKRWHVHEASAAIRNMNGARLAALTEADCERIEAVAGARLEAHGYRRGFAERVTPSEATHRASG
jgi:hypothetical protein